MSATKCECCDRLTILCLACVVDTTVKAWKPEGESEPGPRSIWWLNEDFTDGFAIIPAGQPIPRISVIKDPFSTIQVLGFGKYAIISGDCGGHDGPDDDDDEEGQAE